MKSLSSANISNSSSSASTNNSLGGRGSGGAGGGGASTQLSQPEITAVRQLIAGYRESAAFLLRSADELENLILQQNWFWGRTRAHTFPIMFVFVCPSASPVSPYRSLNTRPFVFGLPSLNRGFVGFSSSAFSSETLATFCFWRKSGKLGQQARDTNPTPPSPQKGANYLDSGGISSSPLWKHFTISTALWAKECGGQEERRGRKGEQSSLEEEWRRLQELLILLLWFQKKKTCEGEVYEHGEFGLPNAVLWS